MSEVTREEFDKLQAQVAENTARLHDGDIAMTKLDMRLQSIEAKLEEAVNGVKALQEKPAKRWESISGTVVSWVVTALLAYIAVKIGLA
ncbi:MAG: hypothetical protein II347_05145 [Lachnospiraceae bacterium]|nr:hypothetical protein [Lachnospiraceae bacterium]